MNWHYYNPNPQGKITGDCVIRALSKAFNKSWGTMYSELCGQGMLMADMPNANAVWGKYLDEHGWERFPIPNTCPNCYTFGDFAKDHDQGTFVLATGTHTATIVDGELFDAWNSSECVPLMAWREKNELS